MFPSNLVYKFNHNICNDTYYGETQHHLKVRACEYLGFTPITEMKVKILNQSAVFDHIFHTGRNASFDNIFIYKVFHNYLQFDFLISIIDVTL